MERYVGRIWMGILLVALVIVVVSSGDLLDSIDPKDDAFQNAAIQLGILYIVALFVERSLEVLIKAWRQGGRVSLEGTLRSANDAKQKTNAEEKLREYKTGTQKRALLAGLTLGLLVSLSGVRLLGPIFEVDDLTGFQDKLFQLTDIVLAAGLIAGGSAAIHQLMALIDDFLRTTRGSAQNAQTP